MIISVNTQKQKSTRSLTFFCLFLETTKIILSPIVDSIIHGDFNAKPNQNLIVWHEYLLLPGEKIRGNYNNVFGED